MSKSIDLPNNTLGGPTPVIQSADDVADAVHWLAWLAAQTAKIKGTLDRKIASAKQAAADASFVEIGGEVITFATWESALLDAVGAYVESHRDDVIPPGIKSAEFGHGVLSLRSVAASVTVPDGTTAQEIADKLAKAAGLPVAIDQLLDEHSLRGILRLKWSLDLQQIQRSYKDGLIAAKALPKGLMVAPAADVMSVKPTA